MINCSGSVITAVITLRITFLNFMYLKIAIELDFKELATSLSPDLTQESIGWDYENVYEWMWVDLPQYDFVLNISREHGGADVDDDLFDQLAGDSDAQRKLMKPGPTYVNAWTNRNGERVNDLPETLAQFFANQLNVDVVVFDGILNVDGEDGAPARTVNPLP